MSRFIRRIATEQARASLWAFLQRLPLPFLCELTGDVRSLEQNKKMQAMLGDVALSKPDGRTLKPDQWKCLFMDAVAKETQNAAFTSKWEPSLDGEGVVNLGYRSSRLSKDEMGELISFIDAWGTEKGVVWSEPRSEAQGEAA